MQKRIFLLLFFFLPYTTFGVDYYWVGGTGSWSDLKHWAKNSGGTTFHDQLPTKNDNVIFDRNSFTGANQSIFIDIPVATCNNMDWTQLNQNVNLTNSNASAYIAIYGSLTFSNRLTNTYIGTWVFRSTAASFIDTKNIRLSGAIEFDMTGSYELRADLNTDKPIKLLSGTLDTKNQAVQSHHSVELSTNKTKVLTLGSTILTTTDWIVGGSNYTVNADNSVIRAENFTGRGIIYNQVSISGAGRNKFVVSNASFKRLNFSSNALIIGNFTVDDITFSGNYFRITPNNTITVNNQITTAGTCGSPIYIASTSETQHASISQASGNVTFQYVALKGIACIGGANFTADDSEDLGSNTGITINVKASENYYWIAGTGTWNNPRNWSNTSGGTPVNCVPSLSDNAIFDVNSFTNDDEEVTITDEAFVKNIDFSALDKNIKLLGVKRAELLVSGNMTLSDKITNEYRGNIQLVGNRMGNTIETKKMNLNNLEWSNAGEWTLKDALNVGTVNIFSGKFDTDGKAIKAENFNIVNGNRKELSLKDSKLSLRNLAITYGSGLNTLTLDAGNSEIIFTEVDSKFSVVNNGSTVVKLNKVIAQSGSGVVKFTSNGVNIKSLELNRSSYINGELQVDDITFTKGRFLIDAKITVSNNLSSKGQCEGIIFIEGKSHDGSKIAEFIKTTGNVTVENTYLYNTKTSGGANFFATQSVDAGNNTGWTFTNPKQPRTLYWVNNGGDWNNKSHWSLSSGGAGGECIPTPEDDVIFDNASFSVTNQEVNIKEEAYAKAVSVRNVHHAPTLKSEDANITFNVFGTLTLNRAINFSFSGILNFKQSTSTAASNPRTITWSQPIQATRVTFDSNSNSEWQFVDALDAKQTELVFCSGNLNTESQKIDIDKVHIEVKGYAAASSLANNTIELGTSTIDVHNDENIDSWVVQGNFMNFRGNQSFIRFKGDAKMRNSQQVAYYRVVFEKVGTVNNKNSGNLRMVSLNFQANGTMLGTYLLDTLTFSAGNSYILDAGKVQTIRDVWNVKGSECNFIKISSTQSGVKATVQKAIGNVEGQFLGIRDNEVRGGATFYAGKTSSLENTAGWLLVDGPTNTPPGSAIQKTLCTGKSIALSALEFTNGATGQYSWEDNSGNQLSTQATLTISSKGNYKLKVQLTSGCKIDKTINVKEISQPVIDLGKDDFLCNPPVNLDATVAGVVDAVYQWQDGSKNATYRVNAPGTYTVQVALGGCNVADSINFLDPSQPININDDYFCAGQTVTKTLAIAATKTWSDGSTGDKFLVTSQGNYSVTVEVCGTPRVQNFTVTEIDLKPKILPSTTTLCGNKFSITLQATSNLSWNPPASYSWSTGAITQSISIPDAGTFQATVTVGGCSRTTPSIDIIKKPEIKTNPDATLMACRGENLQLNATIQTGTAYNWNTGATDAILTLLNQQGTFRVSILTEYCGDLSRTFSVTLSECNVRGTTLLTPNGDNKNDVWEILDAQLFKVSVKIYTRWGNLIFSEEDYKNTWDGKVNGKLVPKGSYYYSLVAVNASAPKGTQPIEKQGVILVMY